MATRILIKGGHIVNEGKCFKGSLLIEDERIVDVFADNASQGNGCVAKLPPKDFFIGNIKPDKVIDATGCYVLPGIIDSHVHFREPGLTDKADIESESKAAAAGGITSYLEMPNTIPQTTTIEALEDKFNRAARCSHVNYSFFFGATNDNSSLFSKLDIHHIPGIKLFMGSSTGNMLVDRNESLDRIFRTAPILIMAHCEDTGIINQNMKTVKEGHGDDPDVCFHPLIRSEEACLASTRKAVELAKKYNARLHVAHISTAEELELFPQYTDESKPLPSITAEVTVGHLFFSMLDYSRLGSRIKVNPAIKSPVDQFMLQQSLSNGLLTTIATDHAPHLLSQKQGGCVNASSGMPMLQFSLVTMLELVDKGILSLERMVQLMAHHPARLFDIRKRGFLRPGYQADVVVVRPRSPWTVTPDIIESKCHWSPMEGHTFDWRVEQTICNGNIIYDKGVVNRQYIGQPLLFR